MVTLKRKETKTKEEELKKQGRRIAILEGSVYHVSDGAAMRYMTPFALELGANTTHIGLLSSLPGLAGNFSQLYTSKAMEKYSRRSICFKGSLLQALMWLPLLVMAILFFIFGLNKQSALGIIMPAILIIIYTVLVVGGSFYSPAWNSWMHDLVPSNSGRYFGMRSRIIGAVGLVSMLVAGFVLDHFKHTNIFLGFAILFAVAFITRMFSANLFKKKYEPRFELKNKSYHFSIFEFIKKMKDNNFGRFVLYASLMAAVVAMASPFFSVYMLRDLHFNYTFFTLVTIASTLANILFMPVWGKLGDKFGNVKIMKITGFLIPLVPLAWLAAPFIAVKSYILLLFYLIAVEAFSGMAFAGWSLSNSNFIFQSAERPRQFCRCNTRRYTFKHNQDFIIYSFLFIYTCYVPCFRNIKAGAFNRYGEQD